jgi:hypothetical protein
LPHGTRPNRSTNNRLIQFLRYDKKVTFGKNYEKRKSLVLKSARKVGFEFTNEQLKIA